MLRIQMNANAKLRNLLVIMVVNIPVTLWLSQGKITS